MVPVPGTGLRCEPPQVSMAAVRGRLVCVVHIFTLRNVLCFNVNDSMLIRNNPIIGSKNVPGVPQQNITVVTFGTALKISGQDPTQLRLLFVFAAGQGIVLIFNLE